MRFQFNAHHDLKKDTWSGSCPAIRNVSAVGDTFEEMKKNLIAELYSQLNQTIDRRAKINIPTNAGDDPDRYIELPFRAIIKLKLYEAMLKRNIARTTLGVRMAVKPTQVDQLFDLTHWTRTSVIEEAFRVMGFSVNVELVDLDTNPELVFGEPNYAED